MRAGPYELLKPLSSGGMGEVYVARPFGTDSEKRVAVKLMLAYLTNEPELVTRFLDEVRLAARMKHPNVVQIFDVGMTDNRPWLAMELVEGVSLYALLERCRQRNELLPLPLVRLIGQGLLDALAYAHTLDGLQVIHRDVSPSNVLVSVDGAVRLTDFGLARARTNATRTSPGGLKAGKLGYMAPEVALPDALVDQRADVFSAGVTLFETLTLLQPFRRLGSSDAQTLEALSKGDALKPTATRGETGAAMETALLKAMRPSPAERFTSVAEMKAVFLDGEVGNPEDLGATVRRLCPEELARFFSMDELPHDLLDAPTVTFSMAGAPSPHAATALTSVGATFGETAVTDLTALPGGPLPEPGTAVEQSPRRLMMLAVGAFVAVSAALFLIAFAARRAPAMEDVPPVAPLAAIPTSPNLPTVPGATTGAAQAAPAVPADSDDLDGGDLDDQMLELLPNSMLHMGTLTAESEPSVMVYLDGKPLAWTPVVRHVVPMGKHVLTFKAKRGEIRKRVVVGEGKNVTVHISGR